MVVAEIALTGASDTAPSPGPELGTPERSVEGSQAAGDALQTPVGCCWQVAGATVRGASHVRRGQPSQDALGWQVVPASADSRAGVCLAASDGHGSAKCFRSDIGARLAVRAAQDVIERLAAGEPDVTDLALLQGAAEEMVLRWRAAVDADVVAAPLTNEELATVEQRDGPGARRTVERSPWVAYGATMLVVWATSEHVVYFQLGDGDILAVTDAGEVSRPMAADTRLFADETTSLCARDAARDVRVALQLTPGGAGAPALILVATDGYANSFRTDAGFLQAGPDLLDLVRNEGLETVAGCLEGWLDEASGCGSGDDVTVGLLIRSVASASGQPAGQAAGDGALADTGTAQEG